MIVDARDFQAARARAMQNIAESPITSLAVQVKKVMSLDITGERTRVYFEPDDLLATIDILTLRGMCFSVVPGTKLKVMVEIVEEGS